MSKLNLHTGILGAMAFSLSFGAVQLASGHDRSVGVSALSGAFENGAFENDVNRAPKADRGDKIAATVPMRTFSIQPQGLANTSVVIRIPLRRETENAGPAQNLAARDLARRPIACEPVVSVLTEIAKRLPPGRCVT
jgi:hypothetical protein